MLKELWPDTFVEEGNLNRSVSVLRKALGEGSTEAYIETVPKHGYRFVAPVEVGTAPDVTGAAPQTSATPAKNSRAWMAAGAVVTLLSAVAVWVVVSRTSGGSNGPPMDVVPLTSLPGNEIHPALSPDGDKVAFAWDGETGGNYDIHVKLVGTETPLRLTNDPADDTSPAWSPDGRQVAFIRSSQSERAVFVVPALGGAERKVHAITLNPADAALTSYLVPSLSWSPDGNYLTFSEPGSSAESNAFSLLLLSLSDLGTRQLTTAPAATRGDFTPAFSPDGRTVAFTRWSTGVASEIFRVAVVAGGPPQQLTFDNVAIEGVAWASDGNELVFSSARANERRVPNLWRMSASGGMPRTVAGTEGALHPVVSRTNGRLAYAEETADVNIWRIDVQSSRDSQRAATRLISSTRRDASAQYSPDGRQIAFVSERSGSREIWVCDSDGSRARPITALGTFLGSPRWAPDGRQIAFDARPGPDTDIFVVNVDGSPPRRVTRDESEDARPSWSRDGRWIYFGSNRTGTWEIWKAGLEGGAPVKVTSNGGMEAFESVDGGFLYYTKGQGYVSPGIWRMPREGGTEVRVLLEPHSGLWALAGTGIYFLSPRAERVPTIEFFSLATARTTHVATPDREPPQFTPTLAVSPDERWILYTQVDRRDNDLTLVQNYR